MWLVWSQLLACGQGEIPHQLHPWGECTCHSCSRMKPFFGSVLILGFCFFFLAAFYSSKYGYKMCLRLYLNGDGTGRGTHLSLFFVVMRGKCDALLKWPFGQKVGGLVKSLHPFKSTIDSTKQTDAPSSSSLSLGDSNAPGSEQQGAHYRCFPPRCHLHLLSAADQRDEHRQWLPALLPTR